MLISKAYAAEVEVPGTPAVSSPAGAPAVPGAGEAFMWNMGMVFVLVILFYVLLIMPQQRRFREHTQMLSGLKKGDKVVTGGGLIGIVDTITEGNDEVVVDLGNGVKVTALRATLQGKDDPLLRKKPANDAKLKKENKK
jgi:preprotein translocase subunit YajC